LLFYYLVWSFTVWSTARNHVRWDQLTDRFRIRTGHVGEC